MTAQTRFQAQSPAQRLKPGRPLTLAGIADGAEAGHPVWDCLPYDRVSPHGAIVAQRMTALARLAIGKAASARRRCSRR